MQDLYNGKVTPAQIAHAAPLVLAQAAALDTQAMAIVDTAIAQLTDLIVTMATIGSLSNCEIHLWGGLFKSDMADTFIKRIEQHPLIQQRHITLVNKAPQNSTTLFAQKKICVPLSDASWEATQKLLV